MDPPVRMRRGCSDPLCPARLLTLKVKVKFRDDEGTEMPYLAAGKTWVGTQEVQAGLQETFLLWERGQESGRAAQGGGGVTIPGSAQKPSRGGTSWPGLVTWRDSTKGRTW